jgi:hypothetical protein
MLNSNFESGNGETAKNNVRQAQFGPESEIAPNGPGMRAGYGAAGRSSGVRTP